MPSFRVSVRSFSAYPNIELDRKECGLRVCGNSTRRVFRLFRYHRGLGRSGNLKQRALRKTDLILFFGRHGPLVSAVSVVLGPGASWSEFSDHVLRCCWARLALELRAWPGGTIQTDSKKSRAFASFAEDHSLSRDAGNANFHHGPQRSGSVQDRFEGALDSRMSIVRTRPFSGVSNWRDCVECSDSETGGICQKWKFAHNPVTRSNN